MDRMTRFLFNTEIPIWRYTMLLALLAIIPAIAIVGFVRFGMAFAGLNTARFDAPPVSASFSGAFGTIVFAPILETILLALLIAILSSFMSNKLHVAAVSGIAWGLGHAAFGLLWFFGPAWSFFILTCAFIAWRGKGFKQAYFVAFIPHVLNNAIGVLIVYLGNHA
jgi:uncharacterized membrane protein YjgN (DUF898 family)